MNDSLLHRMFDATVSKNRIRRREAERKIHDCIGARMQSRVSERLNWTPSGERLRGGRDTTLEATRTGQQEGQATGGGFETGRSMLQDVFSKKLYSLRVDGSLSSGCTEGRAESRQEAAATTRERGAAAPTNRGACCE
jgi:hypothetical protein